jgi:hypothetical protein
MSGALPLRLKILKLTVLGGTPGRRSAARRHSQCERTYMKSTGESPSHPETSNWRAAGGNCVVARRGGEPPEADLRSQIQVNPIRFAATASLLVDGEACRMCGNRFLPHLSYTGRNGLLGRVGVRTQGRYHVEASNGSAADIESPEGSPARGER